MKLQIGDKVLLKERVNDGYGYWKYLFLNKDKYANKIGTIEYYAHNYFLIIEDKLGSYDISDIDRIILKRSDT